MKMLPLALSLTLVPLSATRSPAQFAGARGGDPEAGSHGWLASLQQGKAQARRTGKPLMVVVRCLP